MRAHQRFATAVAPLAATMACAQITGVDKLQNVDCLDCSDSGAGGGADAPAAPSCAHLFCASFDEGDFQKGWTSFERSQGATIALDAKLFKSAPASLAATVSPAQSGSG